MNGGKIAPDRHPHNAMRSCFYRGTEYMNSASATTCEQQHERKS